MNVVIPVTLKPTVDASGLATYEDLEFFPIDGQGFGNEGLSNNFHFTFELHMTFVYEGGEVFSFKPGSVHGGRFATMPRPSPHYPAKVGASPSVFFFRPVLHGY